MARGRIAKRTGGRVIVFVLFFALLFGHASSRFKGTSDRAGAANLPPMHLEELTVPTLRYRIIDNFGERMILFCDDDFYPVALRGGEIAHAIQVFPEIEKTSDVFQLIVKHLGLGKVTDFSDEQKLLVYREYKKLSAIGLSPLDGKYKFSLLVSTLEPGDQYRSYPPTHGRLGFRVEGIIDDRGAITISKKESDFLNCPICLASTTLIDTLHGRIAVKNLRVGSVVWTADRTGKRRQAPIVRTSKTPVPSGHEMVDLILDDARELIVSPGHPTIDGKVIGNLSAGDYLDGRHIVSTKRLPYTEGYTYDILPAGETGAYWADGILIASTLFDTQAKNRAK